MAFPKLETPQPRGGTHQKSRRTVPTAFTGARGNSGNRLRADFFFCILSAFFCAMKRRLLNWLACPECQQAFELSVKVEQKDEVVEGTLTCVQCRQTHPIVRGIPRFVPS